MEEEKKQLSQAQSGVQINIPGNLPVLYTDSVLVNVNQFGVVLDFAQSIATINQQSVVSRLGMSKKHALSLLNVLKERLGTELITEDIKKIK